MNSFENIQIEAQYPVQQAAGKALVTASGHEGIGKKTSSTRSGKFIVDFKDPYEYNDFTAQDHADAAGYYWVMLQENRDCALEEPIRHTAERHRDLVSIRGEREPKIMGKDLANTDVWNEVSESTQEYRDRKLQLLKGEGRIDKVDIQLLSMERPHHYDCVEAVDLADKIFEVDNKKRISTRLEAKAKRGAEYIAEAIMYLTDKDSPDFGRVLASDIEGLLKNPTYDISGGSLARMQDVGILPQQGLSDMIEFEKLKTRLDPLRCNEAFKSLSIAIYLMVSEADIQVMGNDHSAIGRPIMDKVNSILDDVDKNDGKLEIKDRCGKMVTADLATVIYDEVYKFLFEQKQKHGQ